MAKPSVHYLAIDVGASKTLVALFDGEGKVVGSKLLGTQRDPAIFLKELLKVVKKVRGKKPVKAVGLALPGSIDASTRTVLACGNLDWKGSSIINDLEAGLKLPVAVDNDANLGGLAEAQLGAGQGYRTVLYVTVSTGVGTGIVVGGRLLRELSKSEGGMMVFASKDNSYKRLEDLVSGPDFKARFGKYGWDVIDPNIWEAFARDLAAGIFNMVTFINPDVVVLGGGMSVHFAAFRKPLLKYIEQLNPGLYPTPPIKQAKNVETAVSIGCYLLAKSYSSKK